MKPKITFHGKTNSPNHALRKKYRVPSGKPRSEEGGCFLQNFAPQRAVGGNPPQNRASKRDDEERSRQIKTNVRRVSQRSRRLARLAFTSFDTSLEGVE